MQTLKNILSELSPATVAGPTDRAISGVCIDSRQVTKDALFVAVKGVAADGHNFIDKAIAAGATAVIAEVLPEQLHPEVTYIKVADSAKAAGVAASAFFEHPTQKMKVVGVTGTNGKTTVATLLFQVFTRLGYACGLVSTVVNRIGQEEVPATHTTPDAANLQALFARMYASGCTHVFMEVSSHAVHQQRIAGTHFAGGIFTNITHDHLDYHKTFDEYIRVKKQFFDNLPKTAFALTNLDDKRGTVMLQNTRAERLSYSLRMPATIKGKVLENNLTGLVMSVNEQETHFRMIGIFNAYNLLAAYGAATACGEDKVEVLSILSDVNGAPGRFETVRGAENNVLGIVDYAHTPDALLNVLSTIVHLRSNQEQIITVVGCGGDRDKSKRPLMAQVAVEKSDRVVLTSDNPRSENPEAILNDMEAELSFSAKRKVLRITDRKEAIRTACALAAPGDIVLVAGKGHETYQEIMGTRSHFDDKEILMEILNNTHK